MGCGSAGTALAEVLEKGWKVRGGRWPVALRLQQDAQGPETQTRHEPSSPPILSGQPLLNYPPEPASGARSRNFPSATARLPRPSPRSHPEPPQLRIDLPLTPRAASALPAPGMGGERGGPLRSSRSSGSRSMRCNEWEMLERLNLK